MACSKDHMFNRGLNRENIKKIFFSETTKHSALIFGVCNCDLLPSLLSPTKLEGYSFGVVHLSIHSNRSILVF